MAHVMKHTRSSCGHMTAHYDRSAKNIGNENLDRTRTHLNYNLAVHQQMDQVEFVRQRCSEVRCQNRKDVNVMCSWVVTVPKDLPMREHEQFFAESYGFLEKRYGKENVISAYVHMDEVSPHMHFAFVPVTEDKKRGGEKVSAKEVVNRKDLRTFHTDLESHLERSLGHRVNILNEATKDGNKSVSELKKQSCLDEIARAEQNALLAHKMLLGEEDKLRYLKGQKKSLEDEISVLKTEKDMLTKAEVEAMKGEKNLIGGLKGVSFKEFEALKRTAVAVESMAAERDQALARASEADQRATNAEARVSKAYADANQQLKAKIQEVERDRPSLKAQQDVIRLSRENEVLKKDLKRYKTIASDLAEIVRSELPEVYKMLFRTPEKQAPEKSKSKSRSDELER